VMCPCTPHTKHVPTKPDPCHLPHPLLYGRVGPPRPLNPALLENVVPSLCPVVDIMSYSSGKELMKVPSLIASIRALNSMIPDPPYFICAISDNNNALLVANLDPYITCNFSQASRGSLDAIMATLGLSSTRSKISVWGFLRFSSGSL